MALLQSLRHRPFALLWSGQTVSRLGDSLYRIALAWWVLEKTGSATAMGTVMIVSFVPMILFLLVGGVVVDRLHRLRVMVASDLLNGIIVTTVAVLAYSNLLEIWHVYLAGAVFGLVEAFFYPAYTAAVPELTPAEALPSANSLTSLSYQLTGIIGPGLGATLIALGGTPIAFALDAASFFIAVACLLPLIRTPSAPQAPRAASSPLKDLREGWKLVLGSAWLWISILVFAIFNVTAAGPMNVSLPFLVKDSLHADVGLLGLLTSSRSAGSALGTIWTGRYAKLRKRGWIMYLTTIMDGLAVNACLILAAEANGKQITTIEGLARGEQLHPIQQAFVDVGGLQCGFCTPGMILSTKALLDKNQNPTDEEIRKGLEGNFCRCTGYTKIIESVRVAAEKMRG